MELVNIGSTGVRLLRVKKRATEVRRLELAESYTIDGQIAGIQTLLAIDRGSMSPNDPNDADIHYWVRPTRDTSCEGYVLMEQPLTQIKGGGDGRTCRVQVAVQGFGGNIEFVPGDEPFELVKLPQGAAESVFVPSYPE